MIPNDEPERGQMIKRMLNVLIDKTDDMTKWECDFIESIYEQFSNNNRLSNKQCEILERIYDK